MKEYADQLIMESRNNVNHKAAYTRTMLCPNRGKLGLLEDWLDPSRYHAKAEQKFPECPAGLDRKVTMSVRETGMWTTITCPVCGHRESWAAGDGDELF